MSREDVSHLNISQTPAASSQGEGVVNLPEGISAFKADLERDGSDLILTAPDGESFLITNYFDGSPADLIGHNGGVMTGQVVERLAGPLAPGQFAQAGGSVGVLPIGQVETLNGVATAQRADGTLVTLQVGSKVFEDDVITTQDGAAASLTFVDGTIFTMASASRMILDELIYDPDSNSNSGAFNLVEGGFVFIAGKVAGSGGMNVTTPTATMGIRGTTVSVDIQTQDGITTVQVSLNIDPDGGIGKIELRDLDGNLLSTIESTDVAWIVSPRDGETREIARVLTDDAPEFALLSEAFAAFQSAVSRVDEGGTFVELGETEGGPSDPGTPEIEENLPGEFDTETEELNEPDPVLPKEDTTKNKVENDLEEPKDTTVAVNEAPTAGDLSLSTSEDTSKAGQVNGSDPEGEAVFYAIGTAPSQGAVVLQSDGSFDYTPNTDFNGIDSFTIVLSDADGNSSVTQVVVNVDPVNDAPKLSDAGFTMLEDGSLTDQLAATDPDGEAVSLSLASGAQNGNVVLLSNGTFTYTPSANFNGVDSFFVDAQDAAGETVRAKVQVTVTAVDDAPEIAGQTTGDLTDTGSSGASVGGTLTANDPDVGATATWSGNAPGVYGNFSIDPNSGAWTYTVSSTTNGGSSVLDSSLKVLKANETATEQFTVTATDNTGETGTKTIEITVKGINDVPVITGTSTGNVTDTGSSGVTAQGTLIASDPDNDATATWSTTSAGVYGSFAIDAASGKWTYTLDEADTDTRGLKAGETKTETFTVTVTDDQGAVDTQTVSIVVTGSNDAPTVTAITGGTVQETDAPVVLNLLAGGQNDVDGDSLSAVDVSAADDLGGSVTFTDQGSGQISVDLAQFAALGAGESRTVTVSYKVSDGTVSVANTASFVVQGVSSNANPVATNDVLQTAASKVLVVATQISEASVAEAGLEALNRFSQVDTFGQTNGITTSILATYDAVLTFSNHAYNNSEAYGNLLAEFVANGGGVVAATYSFSDGTGANSSLPDGTIGGGFVGLSPFTGTNTLATPEGNLRIVAGAAGDSIFSGVDVNGLSGSYSINQNYANTTLTPNSSSTLLARYDPNNDGTGNDGLLGIARNADGSVIGANLYPGASASTETNFWTLFANMLDNVASQNQPQFSENSATTIASSVLLANDTDSDGGSLSIVGVASQSTNGAALSLVNGDIVYDPTGSSTINALNTGQTLTDVFTYTVSDGQGGTSTASVTVTVSGADETVAELVNLDVLDLTNNASDTMTVTLSDVLDLPAGTASELETLLDARTPPPGSSVEFLTILGDTSQDITGLQDRINLDGNVVATADTVTLTDGSVLNLYSYQNPAGGDPLAILGIDQDIQVNLLTVSS